MSKSVDSGWVLTWKMVDNANHVLARPVAGALGLPILGLSLGRVAQYGCASPRFLHLQVISRSTLKSSFFFLAPRVGSSWALVVFEDPTHWPLVLMMHRSHLVGPRGNIFLIALRL